MRAIYLLLLALSTLHLSAHASTHRARIGFTYWDVGRMYDTIPSRFYDDKEFTPQGSRRWNTERYTRKIENIARVIDSLNMPIIALFGIETESITRQIITTLDDDYSYLHRTIEGSNGLDFALLYYGDILHIERVSTNFRTIHINGELLSQRISITLWSGGYSKALTTTISDNPSDIKIAAGTISHNHLMDINLKDVTSPHETTGEGNTMSYRGWRMQHRIGVNHATLVERSGVYIQPWMLSRNRTSPLPTFSQHRYRGGYSPYLPIFTYLNIECD